MKLFSDEYRRRERWFRYTINPWMSLLSLVTAVMLTAIYHPPLVGTIVIVTGALFGGILLAYGPLSRRRWMEKYSFPVVFLATFFVGKHYGFHFDGRFYCMIAWMMFGMSAPFWIWRKRGLEISAHADPSKPPYQLH